MIEMQKKVDRVENAQKIAIDGRTQIPEESANVAMPRGLAIQIQGLLGKLNSLLHSYQDKVDKTAEQSQQSPAVQVTDLPGI